jgi:uncharacterized membrane protein
MKKSLANMLIEHQSKDLFWISLLFLVVLTAMLPIPFFGIPSGYDLTQHFQFAETYYHSMLTGDFFPGWSADTNFGFGDIGIRFYPPLAYYVLAFTRILTGNWFEASWLTFIFWMFLGAIGVYLTAKEWVPPTQAGLSAALYVVIPYHLSQIYQAFLYAEFAASAILPFCFLFTNRIFRRGKSIDVFWLSVSYALLILTHIPSTIVGSLSLAVFTIALVFTHKTFKPLIYLAVSFALGICAAAFHWVKILTEMNLVNHSNPRFSSGNYDYQQSLFPVYFSSPNLYFEKLSMIRDLTSTLTLIFLLPLIILFFASYKNKTNRYPKMFSGVLLTGLFACFMSSIFSSFLWKYVPLLSKIQFPFRWLSVVSIFGAIAFVTGINYFLWKNGKINRTAFYFAIFFISGTMIYNISQIIIPFAPLDRKEFEKQISQLPNEPSFDCWWTIWSKEQAFDNKEQVLAESREVKINVWKPENRQFVISSGTALNARLATFYYPHWHAEVNGNPVEIQKADDGTMLIPLENKQSSVKIFFQEPWLIKIGSILSILTWLGLFSGLVKISLFSSKSNYPAENYRQAAVLE